MNAAQVLDHFDRISDAPDAIPRLRQFILELAVRGKLVDRDPNDEPASELLKRIQAEKERRIREGQMKTQEALSEVRPDEAWFDIPASWHWVRLGVIAQVLMGQSPKGDTYNKTGEGIPLINGPVEFTEGPFARRSSTNTPRLPQISARKVTSSLHKRFHHRANEYRRSSAHVLVVALLRFALSLRTSMSVFSSGAACSHHRHGKRHCVSSVSRQQIEELPVPLPPLAEQHRIVSKVDELMALCDRIEAAQAERESRRDKLASASLNRLNNGTIADEFREHARFHLRHLPRLTTRPEHIQQLRQTILNLAVRGKLVPQNPNDEPASALLHRIGSKAPSAPSRRLVTETSIPSEKTPYQLPIGWEWCRIGELRPEFQNGASSRGDQAGTPVVVLRLADVINRRISLEQLDWFLSTPVRSRSTRCGVETF